MLSVTESNDYCYLKTVVWEGVVASLTLTLAVTVLRAVTGFTLPWNILVRQGKTARVHYIDVLKRYRKYHLSARSGTSIP